MSAAGYYPFLFKQGSQKLARLAAKNREKQGDKSTNLDFCLYFVHHRHFFLPFLIFKVHRKFKRYFQRKDPYDYTTIQHN